MGAVAEFDGDNVAVDKTLVQKADSPRPALAENCRRSHREMPEMLKMTTTKPGAVLTVPPKIIEYKLFGVDSRANVEVVVAVAVEHNFSERFLVATWNC